MSPLSLVISEQCGIFTSPGIRLEESSLKEENTLFLLFLSIAWITQELQSILVVIFSCATVLLMYLLLLLHKPCSGNLSWIKMHCSKPCRGFYLHRWGHKIIFADQLLGQICEMSLEDWKNLAIEFISWSTFTAVIETLQIPGRTELSCFSFSVFFHLPSLVLHLSVLCSSCPPSQRFPSSWPLSSKQICLAFQSSRPGVI